MNVVVTGPDGFLAWHVRCLARSRGGPNLLFMGRAEFANDELMDRMLSNADAILHLAGVNRASSPDEVAQGNQNLATSLAAGIGRTGRPIDVVYANSIQSLNDSPFGVSKRVAADTLREAVERAGGRFVDVLLPNIFGENGRPFYNSVVSTFCHQLAHGEKPAIDVDREIPLLHAQAAAELLIDSIGSEVEGTVTLGGRPVVVSELLALLSSMSADYQTGELPNLSDPFTRDLFNTYRFATFPHAWPIEPELRSDQRGSLFESVRARGGETQSFLSTTNPGFTRGQHYHLHKVERFMVLKGEADISLRKLFTDDVVTFRVSGEQPSFIDMPTMWVHSITNVGQSEVLTMFYADELFRPERPDTFAEEV